MIFVNQDDIHLIGLSSKGSNYQRGVLLISAGATEGHLKEKSRRKFTKGVLYLHDNSSAHRALVTQKKLVYLGFQSFDHPPDSPDLASSDYHLFPGLKKLKLRFFPPTRKSFLQRRYGLTHKILNFLKWLPKS